MNQKIFGYIIILITATVAIGFLLNHFFGGISDIKIELLESKYLFWLVVIKETLVVVVILSLLWATVKLIKED